MRVALVHDWLTGMRGGERCLEVFCELFPQADLYTLLHVPGSVSPLIEERRIVPSPIQALPGAARRYRSYLPLFPWSVSRWDFTGYDLVLSSSHCVAKAARRIPPSRHLCYCYTPVRYAWDLYDDYFGPGRAGLATRLAARPLMAWLRQWDRGTSDRVDRFVGISHCAADGIRRHSGRDADVIYPPVNCAAFRVTPEDKGYDLVVSALVPYKRVDLAILAANHLKRRLVIVGTGPEMEKLRALAGPTVEFAGWQSDAQLSDWYAGCRSFWFPGLEDFGITPLEAMASVKTVVAYAGDGALETGVGLENPEPTGVFFREQTVDALAGAIQSLEEHRGRITPAACRARAEAFDLPRFRTQIQEAVDSLMAGPGQRP